jgi:hypothetical protein
LKPVPENSDPSKASVAGKPTLPPRRTLPTAGLLASQMWTVKTPLHPAPHGTSLDLGQETKDRRWRPAMRMKKLREGPEKSLGSAR